MTYQKVVLFLVKIIVFGISHFRSDKNNNLLQLLKLVISKYK